MVHSTLGSGTEEKAEETGLGSPRNLSLRSQVPWEPRSHLAPFSLILVLFVMDSFS